MIELIIETLVTTMTEKGEVNFAPMGSVFIKEGLILKPYRSSQTCQNLIDKREGVVNITDDILIMVQAALTDISFPTFPASAVEGAVVQNACRYYEFRVIKIKELGDQIEVEGRIVAASELRSFTGFNRARHALLELAIMATRLNLKHDQKDIQMRLEEKKPVIFKTGGVREQEAYYFLRDYIRKEVC